MRTFNPGGQASDPNPGDQLTFGKVSGPGWLNVATNGSLSGTPLSADVGSNSMVVSVTDPSGLSATTTMTMVVVAAPGIQSTASCQGNVLQLNWSGGIAPYQVKYITNLADPDWKNLGDPLPTTSLSLPATNDAVFYRIYGQ